MNFKKNIVSILFLSLFIVGCASKSKELFNLTPQQWFNHIIDDLRKGEFEDADLHYISFTSEHINSPMIEQTLLILANANMEAKRYADVSKYLNDYMQRYGNLQKSEFATYLKVHSNFGSFKYPNRNQKLMESSTVDVKNYQVIYPNSKYLPLVKTMQVKFILGEDYLNQSIYSLYERTGREESAQIYKTIIEDEKFRDLNRTKPIYPWYMKIFEF